MTEAKQLKEAKFVKIYNDNVHPFKQNFKDRDFLIPAGGFIVMDWYEGHEFKSHWSPVKLDADNKPLPISYKMLRVVDHFPEESQEVKTSDAQVVDAKVPENKSFDCQACGKVFFMQAELTEHLKEHEGQAFNPDVAERAASAKKNKDVYPKV